jgi:hypothetical protein
MYSSLLSSLSPGTGGGPPPRPRRASSSVPLAARRALGGSRAHVAPPDAFLDAIKKSSAAALATNTFTKQVVEVEDFRTYVQVYDSRKPYTLEECAWEEVLGPSHKINVDCSSGVVIFPSVDVSPATHYKMMPFGNIEPTIRDYHGSGVSDLQAGSSLEWRFDQHVYFTTDNLEVYFMVVKIPGSPPPSVWNRSTSAQPEIQTSLDVEKLVRAKFFIRTNEKMEEPCWYRTTIFESECNSWKMAANAGDAQYKTLFEKHSALQGDYLKLAIEKDELQDKHDEVVQQYLAVQKQNSKITHQLFDIQKEMKDMQEKHVQDQVQSKTDNQNMATALYDIHKAMECGICLEMLSDEVACSMSLPCCHVVHTGCHEKQKKKDVCAHCRDKVNTWHKFSGFTAICTTLKKYKFPDQ